MEQSKKLELKLKNLEKAVFDFKSLLDIDLSEYNGIVLDGLKNGQVQKFEFVTELIWKAIKVYLLERHGIDSKTPKQCLKDFYSNGFVDENEYNLLFNMLNDRNSLSHIYNIESFLEIHRKLPEYYIVSEKVLNVIQG